MADKQYRFNIVTIFPEMFASLDHSIPGKAQDNGIIELAFYNPRDYTEDKHRRVDDRPYGGGPGMVMTPQPLYDTVQKAQTATGGCLVVQMTPEGKPLDQQDVQELTSQKQLILLAGRYEGIDERVVDLVVDRQYSIGDYVLSGGELPAMVLIDAITRLLPGVLGHEQSASQESFTTGLLDCPHYTRPESFHGLSVPKVLLSGNHEAISKWRHKKSLQRTWQKRPDLLKTRQLTEEEQQILQTIQQRGPDNDERDRSD